MVALNRAARAWQMFDSTQPSPLRWNPETEATILFATDLSKTSRAGFSWATALARLCQARILILFVDAPPDSDERLLFHNPDRSRARASTKLRRSLPADRTIPTTYRVALGDPARQIIAVAEEENASLVVLGTHQRRGLQRLLLGSVAETVLRQAPCPVFVFRQEA